MRLPVTARTTLLRELRDEIRLRRPVGRVQIAVDGPGTAATAAFAADLAAVIAEDGSAVFTADVDGFRRPRAEWGTAPDALLRTGYDDATLRRVLLDPFREGAQTAATTGFQLAAWDALRDAPVESRWVSAPQDAVLIVHGPFLHRAVLRGLWDYSIWREDGTAAGDAAQAVYQREDRPAVAATAIIDDADPTRPSRAYRDFC